MIGAPQSEEELCKCVFSKHGSLEYVGERNSLEFVCGQRPCAGESVSTMVKFRVCVQEAGLSQIWFRIKII